MWEFTISISLKNKHYIDYIMYEIKHSKLKVITAITYDNLNANITVAVDVSCMQKLANILVECICNIILLVYKREFFINNLELSKCDYLSRCAFLKTLVMFDSVSDKQEIKQEIILNKAINIDSFYHFKLKFMKEKWGEILSIITCSVYMDDNDNIVELLKFLINSLDTSVPQINIYFKDNMFKVYDNSNNLIKSKEDIANIEEAMISQIIELCPKKINLYCIDNISHAAIDMIYSLFDKKINIIT